jgi:hypothetical protein
MAYRKTIRKNGGKKKAGRSARHMSRKAGRASRKGGLKRDRRATRKGGLKRGGLSRRAKRGGCPTFLAPTKEKDGGWGMGAFCGHYTQYWPSSGQMARGVANEIIRHPWDLGVGE